MIEKLQSRRDLIAAARGEWEAANPGSDKPPGGVLAGKAFDAIIAKVNELVDAVNEEEPLPRAKLGVYLPRDS
jgi:hypothetical protein